MKREELAKEYAEEMGLMDMPCPEEVIRYQLKLAFIAGYEAAEERSEQLKAEATWFKDELQS